MAPLRQPKDKEALSAPSTVTTGGGGVSSTQVVDIYQRLGGIERSVTYLEGHAADADVKITRLTDRVTDLAKEVAAAKATFKTLQWVLGIVGGILVIVWGFIGTILTMAIKHYMSW